MFFMPKARPEHIRKQTTRHGKTVWYFRRGAGKRTRLPDEYGSEHFWECYHAALSGKPPPPKEKPVDSNSLEWLVKQYYQSAKFNSLKKSTQIMRTNILNRVLEGSGESDFRSIKREHIQDGVDRRRETPSAAITFSKIMSQLYSWAKKAGYVEENPSRDLDLPVVSTKGHHTWTSEEVIQFQNYFPIGTKPRLAMDMLLYLGARRSDVVTLGKQHCKDGVIIFETEKSNKRTKVYLPILPPLAHTINNTECGDLIFLVTSFNKPFTAKGFGNWFGKHCKKAGVPGRAHGLRKAAATFSANAGATPQQLMAMFGWTDPKMAEHYTKESDKRKLAYDAAMALLDGQMQDQKASPILKVGHSNEITQ